MPAFTIRSSPLFPVPRWNDSSLSMATVERASFIGNTALYQLSWVGQRLLSTVAMERGVPLHSDGAPVLVSVRDEALRAFARPG